MTDLDPLQMDERLGQAQRGIPDPVVLDRQIARVDDTYQRWANDLFQDPECESDPLQAHGAVAGRTLFRDLDRLGEHDPLREYLKRWVVTLGERRINAPLVKALHDERYHHKKDVVASPEAVPLSQMLGQALHEPSTSSVWLGDYLRHSGTYSTHVGLLWQRRAEIAKRWGVSALGQSDNAEFSVLAAATRWLDRTDDMAFEHRTASLAEFIELALARDASLDWPSRLNWRTLAQFFGDSPVVQALKVRSKRLPARRAPASFVRALERFGEQWATARAPADQFFTVAHDPQRLQVHAYGPLFALLLHNPRFLRQALNAPEIKLKVVQRALGRSLLLESRVRALKVLLAHAAVQGRAALEETFVSELGRRLGVQLSPTVAGAIFVPSIECEQSFAGLMLASTREGILTQAHDEDWFRNPRGVDQLCSEARLPPQSQVDSVAFAQGATALYSRLAAGLG